MQKPPVLKQDNLPRVANTSYAHPAPDTVVAGSLSEEAA